MPLSGISPGLGVGGGASATSSGAPPSGGATNDYSIGFDGVDSYVDLGTDSSLEIASGDHSVSFWFRHTMSSENIGLLTLGSETDTLSIMTGYGSGHEDKISYAQNVGGTAAFHTNAGSGVNDGNWHHCVVTVDGGTIALYIDGSSGGSTSGGATIGAYNRLGQGHYGYFNGELANIAIFTSALSSAQVSSIYSSGRAGVVSGALSWWTGDSDSAAGTTLTDEGSESNTGTLTNGAFFTSPLNLTSIDFSIGNEHPSYKGGAFDRDLFDGSLTGSWYSYYSSAYHPDGWIGQDFGSGNEKTLTKYWMIFSSSATQYAPKDWTFEASETGSWSGEEVTLDTQTDVDDWEEATTTNYASKWKKFEFSNSTAYRYYRLNVSENNGHATYLILHELEMYE